LDLRGGVTQDLAMPRADGVVRQALITITSQAGEKVRETIVPLGAGGSNWRWDGRNAAGRMAADGTYAVTVSGLDGSGTSRRSITPAVSGMVTGIERSGDSGMLSLGSLLVPVDALRRVQP
jgi:flagellar hook assembly protein FlgD